MKYLYSLLILLLIGCSESENKEKDVKTLENKPLKALIIDGENNHGIWPKTSIMMKSYLEEIGFKVEIKRKKYLWIGPHHDVPKEKGAESLLTDFPISSSSTHIAVEEPKVDSTYIIDFSSYDLIVSNFGWKSTALPPQTQQSLESFISNGGGLIVVHAANNAWREWKEYNEMIALGGWGNRNEKDGPYLYYNEEGEVIRNSEAGSCGSHGPQMEFLIETRAPEHPIMKGIPAQWLHAKDELYDRLRGPAKNVTILATAYSDPIENGPPWNKEVKGSGRHEPILMAIDYGKGRVFHTTLGHMDYSMECVGFITTFKRGAEWAATGQVTQSIPEDFPTKEKTSSRSWKMK
ncbi:MAG: ThuA domain-containing protein [Bacteroidota bacterium]